MNKEQKKLKVKYKTLNSFVANISNRSMLILSELNLFLDCEEDMFDDDISVMDYFTIMTLRDELQKIVEENANS